MKKRRTIRKILGLVFASILLVSAAFAAEPAPGIQILKYDRLADASDMPANFRTAQSEYKESATGVYPTREGLDELRMSGSSFFSKNEFLTLLQHVPRNELVVIDLRAESHGYINGSGVSWYSRYKTFNQGQSVGEIERREKGMLWTAWMNRYADIATLASDKSIERQQREKVDSVQTEREFVTSTGVRYERVPVTDYTAPTPENVDEFLSIYKGLPSNAWIHVHCEAGIGRTTIFLSMMDMIKNADKISYDDIMTREVLLGGQDVRRAAETTKDDYKKENYPKRALFTKHFYDYVRANPALEKSYTQWTREMGYSY